MARCVGAQTLLTSLARRGVLHGLAFPILIGCLPPVEGGRLWPVGESPSAGITALLAAEWDSSAGDVKFCSGAEAKWMWGDASVIGHWAAEWDLLRWSSWKSIPDTIAELRAYLDSKRPVEVLIRFHRGSGATVTRHYASVSKAIASLGGSWGPPRQRDAALIKGVATFAGSTARELNSSTGSARRVGSQRRRRRQLPTFVGTSTLQVDVRASRALATSAPLEFDRETSRALALMARATYCADQAELLDWSCASCRASGLVIEPGSVRRFYGNQCHLYGFVVKLRGPAPFAKACLLALRGTASSSNILGDLNASQAQLPDDWDCPSCHVHGGFLGYWEELEAKTVAALKDNGCAGSRLFLTGHSLGGALVTLAAWSLRRRLGFELGAVYTYESPRVGSKAFAVAWDEAIARTVPSFRVTYENDPIPSVPCLLGSFVHVQYEVRYRRDGSFKVHPRREHTCSELAALSPTNWAHVNEHCHLPYVAKMCCDSL